MLERCENWIKEVALKSFDLTGQFEDTSVDVETHQNLTHWSAEQFRYMTPIDCSSANIMLAFAKCYEVTGNELMLQKAKALGDNLVACQDVMGKIPTIQSPYLPDFWINCQCYTVKALLEVEQIIVNITNSSKL